MKNEHKPNKYTQKAHISHVVVHFFNDANTTCSVNGHRTAIDTGREKMKSKH